MQIAESVASAWLFEGELEVEAQYCLSLSSAVDSIDRAVAVRARDCWGQLGDAEGWRVEGCNLEEHHSAECHSWHPLSAVDVILRSFAMSRSAGESETEAGRLGKGDVEVEERIDKEYSCHYCRSQPEDGRTGSDREQVLRQASEKASDCWGDRQKRETDRRLGGRWQLRRNYRDRGGLGVRLLVSMTVEWHVQDGKCPCV